MTAERPLWKREVDRFRYNLFRRYIAYYGNNKTQAARALGITRTYMLRLLRHKGNWS